MSSHLAKDEQTSAPSRTLVDNTSVSDEELVVRFQEESDPGRRAPFVDELFRRHHRRVGLWCLRFGADRESALDLAQEIFMRAYQALDSFHGSAKFSTWLYTVARNHCINAARSRSRRPETELGDNLLQTLRSSAETPAQTFERQDKLSSAMALMERVLDPTERSVMLLHFEQELPLDVVTKMLKLDNASGAKAYLVSAKRKLDKAVRREQASNQRSNI